MRAALAPGSAAEDGRAAAARRTPLEIVEKVLTNPPPLQENYSRCLKEAILARWTSSGLLVAARN